MSSSASVASRFQSYLDRGNELAERLPLIAFYVRYYVVERLMQMRKQGQKDAESEKILMGLLDQLEAAKKAPIGSDADGSEWWIGKNAAADRLRVEEFALSVFKKADDLDRGGVCTQGTAMQFFYASKFLDVLEQFDDGKGFLLERSMEEKRKYAKYKAHYIRDCLKQGRDPQPGPPPTEEGEEELEKMLEAEQATILSQARSGLPSGQALTPHSLADSPVAVVSATEGGAAALGPVGAESSASPRSSQTISHVVLFERKQKIRDLIKSAGACMDFDDLSGCKLILLQAVQQCG